MKAIEPKPQAFYASLDDKQKHAFEVGGRGPLSWLGRQSAEERTGLSCASRVTQVTVNLYKP